MIIPTKNKLLFIGDSITDCGREHPVGEGFGLGNGYVSQVNALLNSTYPQSSIRVMNVGTSGNTTRDLAARWKRDVVDLKPDWVSIMIGINDVWRQFDSPTHTDLHVHPTEYQETLDSLIQNTLPIVKGLVLMSPFFIEPDNTEPMRAMMDVYGRLMKQVAQKYGVIFVDTQAAFDKNLKHIHSMSLAFDRVHPNSTGHMILTRAFLDAIEFEWHPTE